MTANILVIAGSLRDGSFNISLANAAQTELTRLGAQVTRVDLAQYPLPLMDENLEARSGAPEAAIKLAEIIASHDGLFIASPEYNASIPPLVKNTIDWVSRVKTDDGKPVSAFRGLTVALGAASDGALGGIRCLYHLRAVLMNVGAQIVTEQCAVSRAASGFAEDGSLKDDRQAAMLRSACQALLEHAPYGRGRMAG
ncbi:MAG TPA: NAD(P)H-dependent oxidoreductase [Rhizobiaceae bacterium]|nr:NAD(P)H-dependent oxidoreductase [Rhizobiaceae bacterium]